MGMGLDLGRRGRREGRGGRFFRRGVGRLLVSAGEGVSWQSEEEQQEAEGDGGDTKELSTTRGRMK